MFSPKITTRCLIFVDVAKANAGSVWPLQLTVIVPVAAQPGVASPSDAVTVSVAGPAAVQVNVGDTDPGSLNAPALAVHLYESGEGPLSESCATAVSDSELPTTTSAGSAEMPSTTWHTLIEPFTSTLPVLADS